MNMTLIAHHLKQYSRLNPRWTQEKIASLTKKYSPTSQEIDNKIMENNLQELLLMDEAEIIKNLKNNDFYKKKV